jgi:hypothetical protein
MTVTPAKLDWTVSGDLDAVTTIAGGSGRGKSGISILPFHDMSSRREGAPAHVPRLVPAGKRTTAKAGI